MSELILSGALQAASKLTDEITHLKSELEKCQAACAVMREYCQDAAKRAHVEHLGTSVRLDAILSTDCGQSLLDRLHTSEQRVKGLVGACVVGCDALEKCLPMAQVQSNQLPVIVRDALATLHKAIGDVK